MASNSNIFGESFPVGTGSIPTFGVPSCMLELGLEALKLLPGDALAVIAASMNEGVLAARSLIADIKAEILEFLGLAQDELDGNSFFKLDAGWAALGDAIGAIAGAIAFVDEIANTVEAIGQDIEAIKECLSGYETYLQRQLGSDVALAPTEAQLAIYQNQVESAERFIEDAVIVMTNIAEVLGGRRRGDLLEPSALVIDPDTLEEEEGIFRLTYGPPRSTKGSFLLSVDGLYYDSQNRTYAASGSVPTTADLPFVPDSSRWKMDHSPNLGGKGTQITFDDLNKYVDTILDPEILDESEYLQPFYEKDHLLEVLEGQKNIVISQLDAQRKDIKDEYGVSSAVYINMQQQIFAEIELFDVRIRKRKKQVELAVKAPDLFGLSIEYAPGEVPVNDFSYLTELNLKVALEKQKSLVIDQGDISGVVLPFKPVFVGDPNAASPVSIEPLYVNRNVVGALAEVTPYTASDAGVAPALTLNDPIVTDRLVAVYNFLDSEVVDTGSQEYKVGNCTGDSRQDMQIVSKSRSSAFPKGLGIPRFTGIVNFDSDDQSFIRRKEHGTYGRLPSTPEMQNLLYGTSGCSFDFWLHMPNLASGLNDFEVKVFDQGLDASAEISSMTLNSSGAGWTDFNFFKAILSNENTGGVAEGDSGSVLNDFSTDRTRGLFIGFTRSKIFTVGAEDIDGDEDLDYPDPAGTLNPVENYASTATAAETVNYASGTNFIIAPMQSYASSGCSFIRNDDCAPEESMYRALSVPLTQQAADDGRTTFSDCSSGFVHVNISFDFPKDTLTVYLNGGELESGSITSTFGTDLGKPLSIPTFKKQGANASFDYPGSIPSQESEDFLQGPRNDPFFTPWIVGGGWTDGLPLTVSATNSALAAKFKDIRVNLNEIGVDSTSYVASTGKTDYIVDLSSVQGGFSGPSNGLYSGLGGHLGSLKIYSKPLSTSEALKNYNAHKTFFDNVEI